MEKGRFVSPLPSTNCANNGSGRLPPASGKTWEQIFCKLNEIEVTQARLVCPYWRTIIDECYKFSITIRERPFEELPIPFKVITCFVRQLEKDADKVFKYPYNVENLRLLDKVNPSTLRTIFTETSNLHALDFDNSYNEDETKICMPEEQMHFKSLLQLKIFHNDGNYLWCGDDAHVINTQRIFSYEMPCLARLDLRMIELWNTLDNILPSFFSFLAKHSKTIKQLRASFIPELILGDEAATLLREELFNEIQPQNIIQELHDPEFQVTTLILAFTNRYLRLWERIINNQNKLVTFHIECNDERLVGRFYFLPFATIQPTLVRNASTLVNLHLTDLTLETNQNPLAFLPIDGLVFQDFKKLRRLVLRRSMANSLEDRGTQIDETTLVNISSIPVEVLEVLEIERLVCETSELERLVENAQKLKIVCFHFTGNLDGKGVTTGIIDSLAQKSDIHIVDVNPVNIFPNKIEALKRLIEIKIQHRQAVRIQRGPKYHYYFNFDRFRKGLAQEICYTRYRLPLFFE